MSADWRQFVASARRQLTPRSSAFELLSMARVVYIDFQIFLVFFVGFHAIENRRYDNFKISEILGINVLYETTTIVFKNNETMQSLV